MEQFKKALNGCAALFHGPARHAIASAGKSLCLGFMLICCFKSTPGQRADIRFDRITSESTIRVKALSQNSIYSMIQDHKGFIWIGTWDGLNKYDGYSFIIYNREKGLSHNTINALLEDSRRNIWIGTDDGLNLFDRQSGNIRQFHNDPSEFNSLTSDFINHIHQDRRGILWISTANGLNAYDIDQDVFRAINFYEKGKDSSLTNHITRVQEDGQGRLWIATLNGIHCYDPGLQSYQSFKLAGESSPDHYRRANHINDLVIDGSGNIYAATRQGVYIINPEKGVVRHLRQGPPEQQGLASDLAYVVFLDDKEQLWIGTSAGLNRFNPERDEMALYRAGGQNTRLSNDDIHCIFQDRSGTLWIGTYNGLNKADQSPSRFTHYFHDPDDPGSLSDPIVYSITDDATGRIWLGTYGGVNVFDRDRETFRAYRHQPGNPSSLSEDKVRTIARDSSGMIWAGTEFQGLNRIDPRSGKITRFNHDPGDPETISSDEIYVLYVSRSGQLWVGTGEGLNMMDVETGRVIRKIAPGDQDAGGLSDKVVWSILQDREDNLWVGTSNGLTVLGPDLKRKKIYRNDPFNPTSLGADWIFSIYEDQQGMIWIGTMGGGLNRLNPATEEITRFGEKQGLPNNVVYAVLEDEEGSLWMSTNRGLTRFNRNSGTFINYDPKDGVQGNEFNAGAYFRNRKGEMYFGGMNGFNVFYPRDITLNRIPPVVVVTRFSIFNEAVDTDLEGGETFRLSHLENYFSIEFSALDYTNPRKNLYRYKLEDYDADWITVGFDQRRAEYRKVNPGAYRFIVTGSNNDGIWNEDGVSITVIVKPPWWQSWWFRVIAAVLITVILWNLVYFRSKSLRRKHEVEKKMLDIEKQVFELEQKALQLQMNPHFIFNSLNAIQNFVLSNETDKAVNYLAKFSHLMRMILANSTTPLISLKDELKSLSYYLDLEQLRFDNKFEYEIIKDPSIDESFVVIPPMLLQPYVENAVIHGFVNSPNRGRLKIMFHNLPEGTLRCIVEDNGIGREKAIEIRQQSGITRKPRGMLITQERLEILNKQSRKNYSVQITDLKDERGEAAGTRVEINIQYQEI